MLKKYFNILFVFLIAGAICVPIYAESVTSKRSKILDMRNEILTDLYSRIPSAKKNVQNAAGYATFSNFGLKIFVTGGGKGSGVAVNNKTKKHTYMKMIELQAGLGIGVKKFRQVWVFKYASDLNRFINSGWELSGQGTAAAKLETKGASYEGALLIKPGVWLYQITEEGLALELTGKGTKYYKDSDLN